MVKLMAQGTSPIISFLNLYLRLIYTLWEVCHFMLLCLSRILYVVVKC